MSRKPDPSFLVKQPHGYCFRINVPVDLRKMIDLREVRYSLKTKDYLTAKAKALPLGLQVRRFFNELRARSECLSQLSPQDIKRLIKEFISKELDKAETKRLLCNNIPPDQLQDIKADYGNTSFLAWKAYTHRQYGQVAKLAQSILKDNGLDVPSNSEDYNRFCRELIRAIGFTSAVNLDRESGVYESGREKDPEFYDQYFPPSIGINSGTPLSFAQATMEDTPLVSEIFAEYIAETSEGKKWTDKTHKETQACLNAFLFFLEGDPQIGTINGHMIRDFKKALLRMPKSLTTSRKYKDMNLKEVLNTNPSKTLTPVTANKYLRRLRSAFRWATNNKYIMVNVAEGVSIPENKKKATRKPFSDNDLKALFNTPEYRGERPFRHPYMFWAPLVALYTGMRNNEIAQLHTEDIDIIDGIPVIRVTDEVSNSKAAEPKQLKRHTSARRIVPLHPHLAQDIGLLRFAEELKKKGQVRLFPELSKGRDGHGKEITRFFCGEKGKPGYLERCGVKKPNSKQEKVFHSFRNTILKKFKEMGVPEAMANQIVGHATKSMSYETYSGGYSLETLLKKGITKLNYSMVFVASDIKQY